MQTLATGPTFVWFCLFCFQYPSACAGCLRVVNLSFQIWIKLFVLGVQEESSKNFRSQAEFGAKKVYFPEQYQQHEPGQVSRLYWFYRVSVYELREKHGYSTIQSYVIRTVMCSSAYLEEGMK